MSSFDDATIISTANEALLSKLSASNKGYFKDDFLPYFNVGGIIPKKPPIINRGYFGRVECINKVIKEFRENCRQNELESIQVVVLGGGYDSLSFNVLKDRDDSGNIQIYEIDFPEVINQKAQIILNKPFLNSILNPQKDNLNKLNCAVQNGYKIGPLNLLGIDMRHPESIQSGLLSSNFDSNLPTLFISECVLVYMNKQDACTLIDR